MKTMKLSMMLLAGAAVCVVAWSGCGNQGQDQAVTSAPSMVGGGAPGGEVMQQIAKRSEPANNPVGTEDSADRIQLANFEQAQPDRFLIKNATMTLEVKDAKAGATKLSQAMQAARGYLSDMQESVDALGVRSVTMQVRVPARGFDRAMQDIESLGKVMDRQVGAEDVTEEFVDSQSRLRNLKRTEERLLAHLGRTGKLSDTLLVEREVTRVRQEIEQLEGRIRFLSHRIAFSTISVTLREAAKATSPVPPESFSSGQIASEASRSLVGFLQSVWSLVIWLAIWSPVWIPFGVVAVFAYRTFRKVEPSTAPA